MAPSTHAVAPRQRILDAHAQLIARDGYANSKITEIAREAHVSLRTFYEEFDSKESCFLVLHEQVVEQVIGLLSESATFEQATWQQAMFDSFELYFRILSAAPRMTAAVMFELATLSDAGYEAREYARGRFSMLMCELVDRGRERYPEIPSRPLTPLLARAVIGAVLELVTSKVVDDAQESLPELAQVATDLLASIVTNADGVDGLPTA